MPSRLEEYSRKHQKEVVEGLKEAYGNEQRLQDLADDLNARNARKAANTIERFLPGLMSYTAFPKQHGKRLRTTNLMERVNRERNGEPGCRRVPERGVNFSG